MTNNTSKINSLHDHLLTHGDDFFAPQPLIPKLIDQIAEKFINKAQADEHLTLSEIKNKINHSINKLAKDDFQTKDNAGKTQFQKEIFYNSLIKSHTIGNSNTSASKDYQKIFQTTEKYPGIFKDLATLVMKNEAVGFHIKQGQKTSNNLQEEYLNISEQVFQQGDAKLTDTALIYNISLAINLAGSKKHDVDLAKKIALHATENFTPGKPTDITPHVGRYLDFHMHKLAISHLNAWNRSVEISLDNKDFLHPVDHAKKSLVKDLYLTQGGAWRDDLTQDAGFMQRFDQRSHLRILNDPAFWETYFLDEKTIPNLSRVLSTPENKHLAAVRILTAVAESPFNKDKTFSLDFKALGIDASELKKIGFDISKPGTIKIIDSSAPQAQVNPIKKSEGSSQEAIAQVDATPPVNGSTALEKLLQTAQTGSERDLAKSLQALSSEAVSPAVLALNTPLDHSLATAHNAAKVR